MEWKLFCNDVVAAAVVESDVLTDGDVVVVVSDVLADDDHGVVVLVKWFSTFQLSQLNKFAQNNFE